MWPNLKCDAIAKKVARLSVFTHLMVLLKLDWKKRPLHVVLVAESQHFLFWCGTYSITYISTYHRNAFVVLCYLPTSLSPSPSSQKWPHNNGWSLSASTYTSIPNTQYELSDVKALLFITILTSLSHIWHLWVQNWRYCGDFIMR